MAYSYPQQSHKPRRRRKVEEARSPHIGHGATVTESGRKSSKPAFPLVAFLWPAKGISQWVVLPLMLMMVGLFRWATGLWGYSGYKSPPMHGDFEAQRHWMEITIHLPAALWYFYDLEWWGLDYPPLTAYHSWLLGKIGVLISPPWFELDSSRGLDDPLLKVFMRATVLFSEYLVYIPSAIVLLRKFSRLHGLNTWETSIAIAALLMQPATLLIDHGHFQYNTVMLGFTLATMSCMVAGRPFWSCVFFVAALGFKQMALFYAPAVFAYLLGICVFPRIRPARFLGIALATVISFILLFTPFLLGVLYDQHRGPSGVLRPPPLLQSLPLSLDEDSWFYPLVLQLAQAIHRIFPFARGLFEDKVANFWCALHTFHKLHRYPASVVSRAAFVATSIAIIPPCFILCIKPKKGLLPLAFAATSWGFFLCSYQVHEKNVLLPLLPMTVLLSGEGGLFSANRAWVGLANIVGCWTLFPLLKRDGLSIPYFVLTLLWAYLLGLPPTSLAIFRDTGPGSLGIFSKLIHLGFYLAMIAWHVCEVFTAPPKDKPDLWVVGNVLIGAAGFGLCYLWCLGSLLEKSQIVQSPGRKTVGSTKRRAKVR